MCNWSRKYFACFSILLYDADETWEAAEQVDAHVRVVRIVDVVDAIDDFADLYNC